MKKSTIWRIVTFSTAAFACAVAFAVINHQKLRDYEQLADQADKRAFSQLCESVSSIDSELARSQYATSSPAMLFRISNEVNRHSEAAKTALASLPASELGLDKTSSFLTVAADFCSSLAIKSASGTELSDDDLQGLSLLRDSSAALSNELNSLYMLSSEENFFSAVAKQSGETEEAVASFASGMSFAEENMPESPVLIYDGPYSSHITDMTAAFLDYSPEEVSVVEGLRTAANFLGLSDTDVKYICRSDGDTKTYTYSDSSGGQFVSVTVNGGHVIAFSENAEVADTVLLGVDAAKLGAEFLASKGYENMTYSYWYCSNGICYINYEYTENDVVIYPDLIQLGVRLDTGTVTYMNAYGYLWNNRDGRDLSPELSAEEAAEYVSGANQAEAGLCIIPSDGKHEILCYEFKCTSDDGTDFLIYINASSGATERIFVLVEDSGGTLTV